MPKAFSRRWRHSGSAGAYGGTNGAGGYGGFQMPDIVANLRIDQAWGSAQIMGALHQVNPRLLRDPGRRLRRQHSHPDDELGFAVGGGVKLNAPMIGQGDYFQTQVNYTEGALQYIFQTPNGNWGFNEANHNGVAGVSERCGLRRHTRSLELPTDVELTTAWNVNAAYEHFWNPRWRTSLYGGYAEVKYSGTANDILCALLAPARRCC